MAYRECPNHGWLETAEYVVNEGGQTVCPVCETATHGYYGDVRERAAFGSIAGPTHRPRERFVEAAREYLRQQDQQRAAE